MNVKTNAEKEWLRKMEGESPDIKQRMLYL